MHVPFTVPSHTSAQPPPKVETWDRVKPSPKPSYPPLPPPPQQLQTRSHSHTRPSTHAPQIFIGASSSSRLGCDMKISFAVTHSSLISGSDSCTCFPGRPFRTSSRRSIISSMAGSSCEAHNAQGAPLRTQNSAGNPPEIPAQSPRTILPCPASPKRSPWAGQFAGEGGEASTRRVTGQSGGCGFRARGGGAEGGGRQGKAARRRREEQQRWWGVGAEHHKHTHAKLVSLSLSLSLLLTYTHTHTPTPTPTRHPPHTYSLTGSNLTRQKHQQDHFARSTTPGRNDGRTGGCIRATEQPPADLRDPRDQGDQRWTTGVGGGAKGVETERNRVGFGGERRSGKGVVDLVVRSTAGGLRGEGRGGAKRESITMRTGHKQHSSAARASWSIMQSRNSSCKS